LYKFNPKNWGVPDYTHFGSRDKAYIEARKAGEKEFMWNRNRYNTQNSGTAQQQYNMYGNTNNQILSTSNEYTKNEIINSAKEQSENNFAEYMDRRFKVNNLAGNPSYNPLTVKDYRNHISRYNPITNTISGKRRVAEEAHGYRNQTFPEVLSWIDSYIKDPYITFEGEIERYNNPNQFEYDTHQVVEPVLQAYINGVIEDNEIPKYINNIRKHAGDNEKMIFNYPFGKNSDKKTITLLQNELVNNLGYTLPKSTKKDGTFDGVWGEETETALNDYRKKINNNPYSLNNK
jgi:hypothetical protein